MSDKSALLVAKNLTKNYCMGEVIIPALRGVSADLYSGEFIVMLGASGSGKSTLLNILGGLDQPTSGELFFLEHDLVHADDRERTEYRRDHVGFVFQFYNLIPSLTALENVELMKEITPQGITAKEALEQVGLSDRMHHFPAQLSGGEQQRVAIARAIVKSPQILLCDEPTGALDCPTGKIVLETLINCNRRQGSLTVIITHNIAIADIADRVIYLQNGSIKEITIPKVKRNVKEIAW